MVFVVVVLNPAAPRLFSNPAVLFPAMIAVTVVMNLSPLSLFPLLIFTLFNTALSVVVPPPLPPPLLWALSLSSFRQFCFCAVINVAFPSQCLFPLLLSPLPLPLSLNSPQTSPAAQMSGEERCLHLPDKDLLRPFPANPRGLCDLRTYFT